MKSEFDEVIALLQPIIPSYSEITIRAFEQPRCSTAVYTGPTPVYYQIDLAVPLKSGTIIARPNNIFSITRRVESLERTPEAWALTIDSMLSEENEQRRFILRRVQQARRQEWLYGGDVRIDGKESNQNHVRPRQRGFSF